MEKYLYLTEVDWCNAWVFGGEVPISLASKYVSNIRDGTSTPDENIILDTNAPLSFIQDRIHPNSGVVFKDGKFITPNDTYYINRHLENGLILSFCNIFSIEIANRLKKKACVKINNIQKLKKKIDKQIGMMGDMRDCEYTDSAIRDQFIKGVDDSWQKEYRLFYKSNHERMIKIPHGTSSIVWVSESSKS